MKRDGRHRCSPMGAFTNVVAVALLSMTIAAPARARTILFIGNSFTFGANSPVRAYRPESVTDLNGEHNGGVPALFKTFADEAGLDWIVSLETSPGKDLAYHLANKRGLIDHAWDVVILQGYSTLDAARPGDPSRHLAAARAIAALMRGRNPAVTVDLVATWSRADQTYLSGGHWFGQPIGRMAEDIDAASRRALGAGSNVNAVVPVGLAWNRAMRTGLADANPYDGIAFGQIDLWSWDQYHASSEGYYLEALIVFGSVTGFDPRALGEEERAAEDLGISPETSKRLRSVASDELARSRLAAGGNSHL